MGRLARDAFDPAESLERGRLPLNNQDIEHDFEQLFSIQDEVGLLFTGK
jgi:hypothetical protein